MNLFWKLTLLVMLLSGCNKSNSEKIVEETIINSLERLPVLENNSKPIPCTDEVRMSEFLDKQKCFKLNTRRFSNTDALNSSTKAIYEEIEVFLKAEGWARIDEDASDIKEALGTNILFRDAELDNCSNILGLELAIPEENLTTNPISVSPIIKFQIANEKICKTNIGWK